MTTTLRRELVRTIENILSVDDKLSVNELAERLADEVLKLRAFDKQEEIKANIAAKSLEFAILTDSIVTAEQQEERILLEEAVNSFESELHFNPLPWESSKDWERFKAFVIREYKKDRNIWKRYDEWRKGHGKYSGAMNNKNIVRNPADFVACFPDFLASTAMYGNNRKSISQNTKVDDNDIPVTY